MTILQGFLAQSIDVETLEIRALEVTSNSVGDAPVLPCSLAQIPVTEPIASVSGEGAYDTKDCHAAIADREAVALVPTCRNGKPWKEATAGAQARKETLRATRCLGRTIRKKWSGYYRRSLVETKVLCFKRLGERIMVRDFDRQVAEIHIRAALLNRFTRLGTPITVHTP